MENLSKIKEPLKFANFVELISSEVTYESNSCLFRVSLAIASCVLSSSFFLDGNSENLFKYQVHSSCLVLVKATQGDNFYCESHFYLSKNCLTST